MNASIQLSNGDMVDLILLGLILLRALYGMKTGLSGEMVSLLGLALTGFVAVRYHAPISGLLTQKIGITGTMAQVTSFAGLTAVTWMAWALLRSALGGFLQFAFRGSLERVGGFVLGGLVSTTFLAMLLYAGTLYPNEKLQTLIATESRYGRVVCGVADQLVSREEIKAKGGRLSIQLRDMAGHAVTEAVKVRREADRNAVETDSIHTEDPAFKVTE